MAFTESEVCRRLEKAITDILKFYKEDLLVFQGSTSDTGKLYNEIAAAFVYDNFASFKAIRRYYRTDSYKTVQYKRFSKHQSNLNTEKQLNLNLLKQADFAVGKIIDAQTPLFNDLKHKYLGKVGNLLHSQNNELFLLNVKLPSTQQTVLRYVVELLLMRQLVDSKKLLIDFGLPDFTELKIAPLLFKDSYPYRELQQNRPNLHHLMALLDLTIFVVEKPYKPYQISRWHYSDFNVSDRQLAL